MARSGAHFDCHLHQVPATPSCNFRRFRIIPYKSGKMDLRGQKRGRWRAAPRASHTEANGASNEEKRSVAGGGDQVLGRPSRDSQEGPLPLSEMRCALDEGGMRGP